MEREGGGWYSSPNLQLNPRGDAFNTDGDFRSIVRPAAHLGGKRAQLNFPSPPVGSEELLPLELAALTRFCAISFLALNSS